ncbi:MAG: hypothetical protein ACI39E_01555 [Acutalibacteraceae bacterium]
MKKRMLAMICCVALGCCLLPSCSASPEEPKNTESFRLSGIEDQTDADGVCAYSVTAPYDDSYTLTCEQASGLAVYQNGRELSSGEASLTAELTAGGMYTVQVKTAQPDTTFSLQAQADNHLVTLPYDVATAQDISSLSVEGGGEDPCVPASVDYRKREGGTYIYSNNPEMFTAEDVGKALLRTPDLSGEVYFTFEHANYSGAPCYLGYQLKNEGETDVYVTVTNVGYQAGGTWFGQEAWCDFYNMAFTLPSDYLTAGGSISSKYSAYDYGYKAYEPRVFQPVTYRLPAGEYFYVIGGTSADAYNGINVDQTANRQLGRQKCANGNVKFCVTGGTVTGTFYVYDDSAQVQAAPEQQGYVTLRGGQQYGAQYMGTAAHAGVIDNAMTWTFNDETKSGRLPVTYTNRYDESLPSKTQPYAAYDSTEHTTKRAQQWMTHLNPQNDHSAVGTDMVEFACSDTKGNAVVIDNDHADGTGKPANTANWMIEYQDHFTLVNRGDTARTVRLSLKDNGSLAMLVRDREGKVLQSAMTTGLVNKSSSFAYEIEVAPHSVEQITLDYVLVACSYGSVTHFASLK